MAHACMPPERNPTHACTAPAGAGAAAPTVLGRVWERRSCTCRWWPPPFWPTRGRPGIHPVPQPARRSRARGMHTCRCAAACSMGDDRKQTRAACCWLPAASRLVPCQNRPNMRRTAPLHRTMAHGKNSSAMERQMSPTYLPPSDPTSSSPSSASSPTAVVAPEPATPGRATPGPGPRPAPRRAGSSRSEAR